jgi:hypothetical protein
LLDLDNLTVEEVPDHLCIVEQWKKTAVADKQGRLLTEEEWLARMHSHDNFTNGDGSTSGKGGKKNPEKKKDSDEIYHGRNDGDHANRLS